MQNREHKNRRIKGLSPAILFVILMLWQIAPANARTVTVTGILKDGATKETLLAATVSTSTGQGAMTNEDGAYRLSLPEGNHLLNFSYIGYKTKSIEVSLHRDTTIDIALYPEAGELNTVTVVAKKKSDVKDREISVVKMEMKDVKDIPVIFGELDILKTVTLLPGIQSGGEGGMGLHVRGGGQDQNLILLDEAPIYNASHLMGFFSVFNGDAIDEVELYKGGIPAKYGGRLSSLIKIDMKDGNKEKFSGSGGIGTITSRLTLEGPIVKGKSSFMISGRRSYADLFAPLAPSDIVKKSKLYFYDLNVKTDYVLGEKDRLYLSGYYGRDVFALGTLFALDWGNAAMTLRWNHLYNKKLVSNVALVMSKFDYGFGLDFDDNTKMGFGQEIADITLKADYSYYLNKNNTISYGLQTTLHDFNPGTFTLNDDVMQIAKRKSNETAIYVEHESDPTTRINIRYGLRYSMFANIGGKNYTYHRDENGEPVPYLTETKNYDKAEISSFYHNLEPRASIGYSFTTKTAVKATYNRTVQYIQQASNTASAFPTDQWFAVTNNLKPQIADQVALGIFRNFDLGLETSAEVYYKGMRNQVDFRDGANLFVNEHLDGELLIGKGWSYGTELFLKKTKGSFTGFVSYTWSKTMRQTPGINHDKAYAAGFDQRHNLSVVATKRFGDRWVVSGTFVFNTGTPFSPPVGKYYYDGTWNNVYGERNSFRIPNYHRADLGITLKSKATKKFKSSWNLSVYNLYNRENPYVIYFPQATEDQAQRFGVKEGETIAVNVALFKAIPSITWNFKF